MQVTRTPRNRLETVQFGGRRVTLPPSADWPVPDTTRPGSAGPPMDQGVRHSFQTLGCSLAFLQMMLAGGPDVGVLVVVVAGDVVRAEQGRGTQELRFFGIDRELRIVELGMNEWMSVVLVVDLQGRENLDELHVTFT